jgi:ribonuclease HII
MRYIVGIDEVGRGPLAGPVSIGIVVCKTLLVMPELTDSKKMTAPARERAAALAGEREAAGELAFGVYSAPARVIDAIGIEAALRGLIAKGLKELAPKPSEAEVILDGRLFAPKEYHQQTVIRGDVLVPAISLAAVVAKVSRDRYMEKTAAKKYPGYGFENHKGYGTAEHLSALKKLGASPMHRMTYLSKIIGASMPA